MSCNNCMEHKPFPSSDRFTCPECKQEWRLANVWPGRYWEPKEIHEGGKMVLRRVSDGKVMG